MAACKQCGKPKPAARKGNDRKVKAEGGQRMPRQLWLYHLELDDFCSRECCEDFHGVATVASRVCGHPDCNTEFVPPRTRTTKVYCSKVCASNARRAKSRGTYTTPGVCAGCGRRHDDLELTPKCPQCWDRARRRRNLADPVKRQKILERERRYKKRRRELRKLKAAGA